MGSIPLSSYTKHCKNGIPSSLLGAQHERQNEKKKKNTRLNIFSLCAKQVVGQTVHQSRQPSLSKTLQTECELVLMIKVGISHEKNDKCKCIYRAMARVKKPVRLLCFFYYMTTLWK